MVVWTAQEPNTKLKTHSCNSEQIGLSTRGGPGPSGELFQLVMSDRNRVTPVHLGLAFSQSSYLQEKCSEPSDWINRSVFTLRF